MRSGPEELLKAGSGYPNYATAMDSNVYFGGKRVGHGVNLSGAQFVLYGAFRDRVGSSGSHYSYGEDKGTDYFRPQEAYGFKIVGNGPI